MSRIWRNTSEFENYPTGDLKALWAKTFGSTPPIFARKEFLIDNLHYHRHCQQHGPLKPKFRKMLANYYQEFRKNPEFRPTGSNSFKSGTRLVREWQGDVHTVTVTDNGFEYQDKPYKSLSAIARLITGTQWSGPAFFGLPAGGIAIK